MFPLLLRAAHPISPVRPRAEVQMRIQRALPLLHIGVLVVEAPDRRLRHAEGQIHTLLNLAGGRIDDVLRGVLHREVLGLRPEWVDQVREHGLVHVLEGRCVLYLQQRPELVRAAFLCEAFECRVVQLNVLRRRVLLLELVIDEDVDQARLAGLPGAHEGHPNRHTLRLEVLLRLTSERHGCRCRPSPRPGPSGGHPRMRARRSALDVPP
mmetsp:Transcript_31526/g.83936  ORF Transcript_31526/g.83936 Transcript_31526/m.83936 type:complete len:210 (+) Transcript_31526:527-1156(+)